MSNIEYINRSYYRGAKIRTYVYETITGPRYGVDVFFGDHEYHYEDYPSRAQAEKHGQEYVDSLPGVR